MTTLLRGRVLDFHRRPEGPDDLDALIWHEDGAVLIDGGTILAMGEHSDISADPRAAGAAVVDHRPHLILPGFIDAHLHFPQGQVVASWAAQLLDWLNDYTFPAEARYADPAHAARMAEIFLDLLLARGTTTACAFGSSHPASVDALFTAAEARGMRMIAGLTMMDRNCPDGVRDTAQSSHDHSAALIGRWHGRGRAGYAITPRFAITSTPDQLEAAGALARAHPDCHIQTHLSENHDEIAYTLELYPDAKDYLDIYQRYGLVGPKSLLGHAIHLKPREIDVLAETGAHPVFCPTSNLFLGSGLYDAEGLRKRGITAGIATDIGGGTDWSMLPTLAEGYKVMQLQGQRMHPFQAFWWATRGNAEVLGLEDKIGSLAPGSEADLVVLNPTATPAMEIRIEAADTLADLLFTLQIMGDDRAVAATYVGGKRVTQA